MTCWLRPPRSTALSTAWSLKSVVVDPWRLQGLLVSSAAWPVLVASGQGRQWCGPQTGAAGDSEDYRKQWQQLASWQRLASNTCIMVEARAGTKGGTHHKHQYRGCWCLSCVHRSQGWYWEIGEEPTGTLLEGQLKMSSVMQASVGHIQAHQLLCWL